MRVFVIWKISTRYSSCLFCLSAFPTILSYSDKHPSPLHTYVLHLYLSCLHIVNWCYSAFYGNIFFSGCINLSMSLFVFAHLPKKLFDLAVAVSWYQSCTPFSLSHDLCKSNSSATHDQVCVFVC